MEENIPGLPKYNRFHKETLLKFRHNVFTCPGNGKISAIVAAREATVHFQKYYEYLTTILHMQILILKRMILYKETVTKFSFSMLNCPVNDQTAYMLFTGDAVAVCHRLN